MGGLRDMNIKNNPLYQELLKKEYYMLDDLKEYDTYSTVTTDVEGFEVEVYFSRDAVQVLGTQQHDEYSLDFGYKYCRQRFMIELTPEEFIADLVHGMYEATRTPYDEKYF